MSEALPAIPTGKPGFAGVPPPPRKRRDPAAVTRVPEIPWEALAERLRREWGAASCFTFIGPRGSGKTHMAVTLAEMRQYVLVLSTKRRDPIIEDLRAHGYKVTGDLSDITWSEREPLTRKVVFWPQFPDKWDGRKRQLAQAAAMRQAMDWADKTGGWTVLIDETMWMVENLKLDREIKAMYFQGRTQGLSVLACAQRPSHVPRLAFSSADYLFLWQTGDRRDVLNLREISSGIPTELIEESVKQLQVSRYEALFIDVKRREIARVVAPPR